MISETPNDVVIIGAGLAGLTAARELQGEGWRVAVLEKSRGLGGRASTRRWGELPVDHGAQFFTARSPEFRRQVELWLDRGVCFCWAHGFHRYAGGSLQPPGEERHPRYACRRGMSALGRDLAEGLPDRILRETKAETITQADGHWQVGTGDGRLFTARALLVTAPPEQAAALLRAAAPGAAETMDAATMVPCFALAARFARTELPWQGIQLAEHPVLSWVGNDTSKRPDAHGDATVLMLHASPEFSTARFEAPPEEVRAAILDAASHVAGLDLRSPQDTFLHRWRYAQPATARTGLKAHAFHDQPAPLALAGDALGGGKIEGAWLSGLEAARALAGCLRGLSRPAAPTE